MKLKYISLFLPRPQPYLSTIIALINHFILKPINKKKELAFKLQNLPEGHTMEKINFAIDVCSLLWVLENIVYLLEEATEGHGNTWSGIAFIQNAMIAKDSYNKITNYVFNNLESVPGAFNVSQIHYVEASVLETHNMQDEMVVVGQDGADLPEAQLLSS